MGAAAVRGRRDGLSVPLAPPPSAGPATASGPIDGVFEAIETAGDVEIAVHVAHDLGVDLPDPFDFDDRTATRDVARPMGGQGAERRAPGRGS